MAGAAEAGQPQRNLFHSQTSSCTFPAVFQPKIKVGTKGAAPTNRLLAIAGRLSCLESFFPHLLCVAGLLLSTYENKIL